MSITTIPHGPTHAQVLISLGFNVTPLASGTKRPILDEWNTRITTHTDFNPSNLIGLVCGIQPDGSYVIALDFDHKPEEGMDAEVNFQAFFDAICDSDILDKIFITRSTSGTGYHAWIKIPENVTKGLMRDSRGKKMGDFLGQGGQIVVQAQAKWIHRRPDRLVTLTRDEAAHIIEVVKYHAPIAAGATSLDWQAVAYWSAHIETLLTNGIPSRFRPTCQGAYYLRNAVPYRRTSEIRFALIEELIRCEYDDAQTAALALHLADFGVTERKGRKWLEDDVARIISKVNASGPRTRRKAAQRDMGIEVLEEKVNKHEATYLFWAQGQAVNNKVMMSRPERAKSYGVGLRTLDRIEADLGSRGKIKRGLSDNRQIAWIEIVTAQPDLGTATTGDTQGSDLDTTSVLLGGVWGGGSTKEAAAPILAHVVEDAIETLGESRVRKRRADIILGLVRAFIPDADPEQVAWQVKHAIDWRRQRRADDALREKLRGLTLQQLKSKHRGLSNKAADLHKEGKPRQAWVFSRLAWFCQKELDTPERQAEQAKGQRVKAIQQVLGGVS